jgi:hypothetical protein
VWTARPSRTSKRMGLNGGLANWRLRSGKRATDLTPSGRDLCRLSQLK